ncbi:MAG: LysR family transcriptional regulator [Ancylobacter novellus]|uniref:LysR family transcriptional regulator n=1 Tax=Ancylobacter novellus TaxID=921 RepID=A0A2W5MQV8_ANCNO|nr:MAG: LysR family transcriptional regulator [Ancylobacter novellus]
MARRAEDARGRTAGRRELPPLHLLRAFEAVGRTGSMRKAADAIGVSHTVVSRHVQNLEFWMRRKLVATGPRGATLTAEGQALYGSVSRAFGAIAASVADIRGSAGATLKIWCMPGLAMRWLSPRLSELTDALPEIEIELRAIDRAPDFDAGEADVLIGYANDGVAPAGGRILAEPRMFPVASPKWLDRTVGVQSLAELSAAPLIHEESHDQWIRWFAAAGAPATAALRGPKLWDANLGLDAALKGHGVSLASDFTAADELAHGTLVELFETDVRLGCYYLLQNADRRWDAELARFSTWLAEALDVK